MRAKEFIAEKKNGKLTKRQQQSTRGVHTYGDGEMISGDYTAWKMGQAVAMADGSNEVLDIDAKSWAGKRKTAHPYSQVENDMLKQAYKAVGADWQDMNHGDMVSKELEGTYTVSPVSNWNKKK
jgi:hypothetical protein